MKRLQPRKGRGLIRYMVTYRIRISWKSCCSISISRPNYKKRPDATPIP